MKKLIAFTILSLAVLSCKKDKIEVDFQPAYKHVTTAGSYWVYDWYQVDSTGNETLIPNWRDTIRIAGDTLIGGKTFQIYRGTNMGSNTEYYSRDSSGYIVGINGAITYSYVSSPRLLRSYSDGYINYENHIGEKQPVNTAFGSRNASTTYLTLSMADGSPMNVCGDQIVRFYNYYVSGLGCTSMETEYFGFMQVRCSKKTARLSAYYIAP